MEETTQETGERRFTHRMPVALWRRLRVAGAKRDLNMTQAINTFLTERLDELDAADSKA